MSAKIFVKALRKKEGKSCRRGSGVGVDETTHVTFYSLSHLLQQRSDGFL